jgi:hypothetical protein
MKLTALTHPLRALARSSALLATLVAALTLTACGGGGGSDAAAPGVSGSPSTNPTGTANASNDSFSSGVISGFGSIIVNGVRFDDSKATVNDDDDDDSPTRTNNDLRLGMVVSVTGTSGTGTNTATGTATAINFGSELQGPVQSINGSTATGTPTSTTTTTTTTGTATVTATASTQTLVILGQTVLINARTLFDPVDLPSGFASIRVGSVLEVHGFLDPATNVMVATRIERKNIPNAYKITGNVASFNAGSKTFKIGSETISYATVPANRLNVNLVDGITVRARLSTLQTTTGTWNATRVKSTNRQVENRNRVEIEGVITSFTSATNFSVRGLQVNASNASFPKGTAGLALGAQVEVKGSVVTGTLVATSVKVESGNDDGASGGNGGNSNSGNGNGGNSSNSHEIELHGAISSLNTGSKTFSLRGVTVSYSGTVAFDRGTAADLVNNAKVEVKGVASATGTTVVAQKIKFEN